MCGVGLDVCLNSWEKCIIYWHYFGNYFNAMFITALHNKLEIFVMEEEYFGFVSSRTPKHSQVPLVLPQRFVSKLIAHNLSFFPALPLSCLELPAENQVFVVTQDIESLLSLRTVGEL